MSRLRAFWIVHPFPSVLNAILVFGLFLIAGGEASRGAFLALGMLGIQFSIGTFNDVADADADRATKPTKPIARGLVRRTTGLWIGVGCGVLGLLVYAAFGPLLLALGALMLAIGLAYDLGLKRAGFGWLCFAAAFPLLPLSTWLAAMGALPPRAEILLPVAALAGPALQVANGLVDLERDRASGIPAPVVRLGRRNALLMLGALLALVYGLAWLSLLGSAGPPVAIAAVALATALAGIGTWLSASTAPPRRERGWQVQAVGIALLAAGWVAAATQGRG